MGTPLLFIYVLETPVSGLVKSVTGNQWYWIYGCVSGTNFFNKSWSSAMVGGTLTAREVGTPGVIRNFNGPFLHMMLFITGVLPDRPGTHLGLRWMHTLGGVTCLVPHLCITVVCIRGIVLSCVGSTILICLSC